MKRNYNTKQVDLSILDNTRTINLNYLIKVFGYNQEGKQINTLVGVSGLINLIGAELASKFVQRAFDCMADKCECKLRRGLKVTFYCH